MMESGEMPTATEKKSEAMRTAGRGRRRNAEMRGKPRPDEGNGEFGGLLRSMKRKEKGEKSVSKKRRNKDRRKRGGPRGTSAPPRKKGTGKKL